MKIYDSKEIDIMKRADNVYSTLHFIVSQFFRMSKVKNGKELMVSVDTYYPRTEERDI